MEIFGRPAGSCVAVLMLFSQGASAARLQLSTGIEYSTGDYGELTSTQAVILPFSAKLSLGGLSLRASVPYLLVRGPADITAVIEDSGGDRRSNSGSGSGGGRSGSGSSGTSSEEDDEVDDEEDTVENEQPGEAGAFPSDREEQGLGDAMLSATWSFNDIGGTLLYLDLTGRVRLPTGDEATGLGLGTTDYIAQGELGWDGRRGGVHLGVGRRFLESQPGVMRQDGWQASAGFWRNVGRSSVFGIQGNWREASIAGDDDPQSIDAYLTRRFSRGWRVEVSGGAGFSDASADFSAGLNFIWRSSERR